VNVGEIVRTLGISCIFCVGGYIPASGYALLEEKLLEDYMLAIHANGQECTFNSVQFLKIIKRATHIPGKGDYWLINDTSLCPKP
jgi:hypothetical protein